MNLGNLRITQAMNQSTFIYNLLVNLTVNVEAPFCHCAFLFPCS